MLNLVELKERQHKAIGQVVDLLCVGQAEAERILRHYRWWVGGCRPGAAGHSVGCTVGRAGRQGVHAVWRVCGCGWWAGGRALPGCVRQAGAKCALPECKAERGAMGNWCTPCCGTESKCKRTNWSAWRLWQAWFARMVASRAVNQIRRRQGWPPASQLPTTHNADHPQSTSPTNTHLWLHRDSARLEEDWFNDPDRVREKVGLIQERPAPSETEVREWGQFEVREWILYNVGGPAASDKRLTVQKQF